MNEETALAAFAALSNETRLRIVKALVKAGPEGLPAGEIADAVGATPSRASFHLSTLGEAGLVTQRRDAKSIIYNVDFAAMGQIAGYLLKECCANDSTARACCG